MKRPIVGSHSTQGQGGSWNPTLTGHARLSPTPCLGLSVGRAAANTVTTVYAGAPIRPRVVQINNPATVSTQPAARCRLTAFINFNAVPHVRLLQ